MTDFNKAISAPFSDWKKLSIGALLYMIPFVNWVSGIFAYGYALLYAKSAAQNKHTLPEWKNWGDLFVKGILALVISVIYFLPVFIILVALFMPFMTNPIIQQAIMQKADWNTIIALYGLTMPSYVPVLFAVSIALYLFTAYIIPLALMMFINKDRFGAAFQFKEICRRAFTGKYFVAMIVAVLYSVAVSFALSIPVALLGFTVVLPYVINGYMAMVLQLTMVSIYGQVYAETTPARAAPVKRARKK